MGGHDALPRFLRSARQPRERDHRGRRHRLGEPDTRASRRREIYRRSAARRRARTAGADSDRGLSGRGPARGFEPRDRGLPPYTRLSRRRTPSTRARSRRRSSSSRSTSIAARATSSATSRSPETRRSPELELLPLIALKARRTVRQGHGRRPGSVRLNVCTECAASRVHRSRPAKACIVPENAADPDRETDVQVAIVEGPRTLDRHGEFRGQHRDRRVDTAQSGDGVRGTGILGVRDPGSRERIDLEYRNRGYEGVVVTSEPTFAESDTRADIVFRIAEGPQVMVDHIIIVGNRRISTRTIERELLLREGRTARLLGAGRKPRAAVRARHVPPRPDRAARQRR